MLTSFNRDLELVNGLESNYVRILYYDLSQNYSSSYKSYEYSRLCTILDGEKKVSVDDGSKFTYDRDKFLLLPPHSTIHMDIPVPTKALVFELNNNLVKDVAEKVSVDFKINNDSLAEDNVLVNKMNNDIKGSINKIDSILTKSNKNVEFLMDLYSQELVYNLIQIKGVNQVLNLEYDNPVYKAVKFMQEHYNSPLSINSISSELNMSDANFCQYFKKIMGITPKEYLTNLKLAKAREMIKNTSVTETAFELGYENISHFITLFKSKYGATPKQYKKEFTH